jgi:hypothetical protein
MFFLKEFGSPFNGVGTAGGVPRPGTRLASQRVRLAPWTIL